MTTKVFYGLPIGSNVKMSQFEKMKNDNPDAQVFVTKEKLCVLYPGGPCSTCGISGISHFVGYEMPEGKDCILKVPDRQPGNMLWTLTFDAENLCTNISFKGYKEFYDKEKMN